MLPLIKEESFWLVTSGWENEGFHKGGWCEGIKDRKTRRDAHLQTLAPPHGSRGRNGFKSEEAWTVL